MNTQTTPDRASFMPLSAEEMSTWSLDAVQRREHSQAEQLHFHALNRVIPAMCSSGFTISTNYGDLLVEPGDQANQMAKLLEHFERLALLRLALLQRECAATQAVGQA